ncbi:hypothetical protein F5X96DRAFT_35341 [Biscogniauxia mediterranea]|nr:hypothetical protein F5X96DRAFT_35341 [Biscogniauxia mediterranea]
MSLHPVVPERQQPPKLPSRYSPLPPSGAGTPRSIPTAEPCIVRSARIASGLSSPEDVSLDDYPLPISVYAGRSSVNIREFPSPSFNYNPSSSYTLSSYPLSTHRPSRRPCLKPNTRETRTSISFPTPPPSHSNCQAPERSDIRCASLVSSIETSSQPTIPRATASRFDSHSLTDRPVYDGYVRGAGRTRTDIHDTNASRWKPRYSRGLSMLMNVLGRLILKALCIARPFTRWLDSPQRNWPKMNTIIAVATLAVTMIAALDPLDNFFRVKMEGGSQETRAQNDYCDCSPYIN